MAETTVKTRIKNFITDYIADSESPTTLYTGEFHIVRPKVYLSATLDTFEIDENGNETTSTSAHYNDESDCSNMSISTNTARLNVGLSATDDESEDHSKINQELIIVKVDSCVFTSTQTKFRLILASNSQNNAEQNILMSSSFKCFVKLSSSDSDWEEALFDIKETANNITFSGEVAFTDLKIELLV